ncbi:MAG: hypothetical protein P8X97_00660 [Candidatus Bathyarchaeota archaeon]
MNRDFIILFLVVNVLVIGFGGFIAYSDLYLREYSSRYQHYIKVTEVDYLPLVYRPTYDYYYGVSTHDAEHIISKGSWSLDLFQFSILIMVLADLFWINFERKKIR